MNSQETLRFTDEELALLRQIHERALKKHDGYAPKAHVLKELLGLAKPNRITEEDRECLTHLWRHGPYLKKGRE